MILITGGTGFIGSHLDGDIKLSSKDVDLMDLEQTIDCFKKYKPDTLIHCAAKQKNYIGMKIERADHFYDNMLINMNVFNAAAKTGIKSILTFSSINALCSEAQVFVESKLYLGEPSDNCYTDGYKNRMLHVMANTYKTEYGINCVVPILTNIYGPNSPVDNGVIPILISKIYKAKVEGKKVIEIDGDGSPTRDFLYVKDLKKIVDWMLREYNSTEPLILASGYINTVRQIVELIVEYMKYEGKIEWLSDKDIGESVKICNNSKLMSYLPDFEFTSIEEGIREMVVRFTP